MRAARLWQSCSKDAVRTSLGTAIGQAYQVFGYTQAEIGEHVGLTPSMVCKISRGVRQLNHTSHMS